MSSLILTLGEIVVDFHGMAFLIFHPNFNRLKPDFKLGKGFLDIINWSQQGSKKDPKREVKKFVSISNSYYGYPMTL